MFKLQLEYISSGEHEKFKWGHFKLTASIWIFIPFDFSD